MTGAHAIEKPPRFEALDVARGLALAGMFTYHLAWDLGYFGLIDRNFPMTPGFKLYGHVIATSFLALVGASLVLASRGGFKTGPYLQRLTMIVAACAGITAATYWMFPESYIFFGILHLIAIASVVALPFLNAPVWLTFAAGAAVFAAPFLIANAIFDQPIWQWSGLGLDQPNSNDWRPVFPWLAFTLFGVAGMRSALAVGIPERFAAWRASNAATRTLVFGGRHSLAVYLIHQPVFIALVFVAAQVLKGPVDHEEAPFREQCSAQCVAAGGDALMCDRHCGCMVTSLRNNDLWKIILSRPLTQAERDQVDTLTRMCARQAADGIGAP